MHPRNDETPQQLTERLEQLYRDMGLSTQAARQTAYGHARYAQ